MAKQTLFAVLSRAPWWVSVIAAGALFASVRLIAPDMVAAAAALPFLAIAGYAGWLQLRAPSVGNIDEILARVRGMPWENFSAIAAEAFRRDGYAVTEVFTGAVDLKLEKSGRVTLVNCKRWKVAQTGIGPLRELHEAKKAIDASYCMYVTAGDFTANEAPAEAKKRLSKDEAVNVRTNQRSGMRPY